MSPNQLTALIKGGVPAVVALLNQDPRSRGMAESWLNNDLPLGLSTSYPGYPGGTAALAHDLAKAAATLEAQERADAKAMADYKAATEKATETPTPPAEIPAPAPAPEIAHSEPPAPAPTAPMDIPEVSVGMPTAPAPAPAPAPAEPRSETPAAPVAVEPGAPVLSDGQMQRLENNLYGLKTPMGRIGIDFKIDTQAKLELLLEWMAEAA